MRADPGRDAVPPRCCAEPLAVALRATARAGTMVGRQVLVAGAGPIGLLCLASCLHLGAAGVTIIDLCDPPLEIARTMGAAQTVNVLAESDRLDEEAARHGGFDIAIEATGAPASVARMPSLMRLGGRIVQLGMPPPGTVGLPANLLMAREIDLVGSFRFHDVSDLAVATLGTVRIELARSCRGSFRCRRRAPPSRQPATGDARSRCISKSPDWCARRRQVDDPLLESDHVTSTRMSQEAAALLQRYGAKWTYTLAINDLYFDFIGPPVISAGRNPKGPPVNISAGDGSNSAYEWIRGGQFRAATVPEPLLLQGWQVADELNRGFAGQPPSGYVAPVHLVTAQNVDLDGGKKDIYDPDNHYRDAYKIWGR